MIEAVGHQYFKNFFQVCNGLLKEDGKMLIQAITISDQRFDESKNSIDFIRRYIFPGGCLPSNSIIAKHVSEDTNMQIADIHDITYDYALTLAAWRERFFKQLDQVKSQGYNDVFIRMWDFYLCYCEGGFRERVIQTSQFLMTKPRASYKGRYIQ
jgi:cyclopropane-fatty-acyl-phospholipid synthase